MRCPKCGAENGDDFRFCRGCGASLREDASRNPIPSRPVDHLFWSVLATFFISFLSLIPLTAAIMARRSYAQGQYELAERRAELARRYFWITLLLGFIVTSVSTYQNWDLIVDQYRQFQEALEIATGERPKNADAPNVETVEKTNETPTDVSSELSLPESESVSETTAEPADDLVPSLPSKPTETESSPGSPRGAAASDERGETTIERQSLNDFLRGGAK